MERPFWDVYTQIIHEEIAPATGYSEPIAVAYCAAKAHEVLGMQPTAVTVSVSGNVLKNVKSVVVPHTNGLKGIRAAVAAGIVCGSAETGMQVLTEISQEQSSAIAYFAETVHMDVSCAETECPLYISVTLYARTSYSRVVIANGYTNIVEIMKNGEAILKRPILTQTDENPTDRSCLNLHDIMTYADNVDLSVVKDVLDLQIRYNTAICEEGLSHAYGANLGRVLLQKQETDASAIACAYAAAGCEARMNGCEMPVAILCGSGNQGIVASVPVICYAKQYGIDEDRTARALLLSDLLTISLIHQAERRSDICGAVHAGCAAGAAVAYLLGGDERAVEQTLTNAVSCITGETCDGTRPSCPAKVAFAVETGILGYQMYLYQKTGF